MKFFKTKYILIFIIIFLILVWGGTLIKCEFLTYMHGDEFMKFDEINTSYKFKILSYTEEFAYVYCINFNQSAGTVHSFITKNNKWEYNCWEKGGWSKIGTASGIVWPYWWHSIFIF